MKSCPKCGAANDNTAEFCGLCMKKFSYDSNCLPPVPPAPKPIFKRKQRTTLLSPLELFNRTCSFFIENVKFYILLSLVFSGLAVAAFFVVGGSVLARIAPLLTTTQPPSSEALTRLGPSLIFSFMLLSGLMVLLFALGSLSYMIATVEMSKGFETGVFAVLLEAVKKLLPMIWIFILKAVLSSGIIIFGVILTVATQAQSPAPLIASLILGLPVAIVVGTWFSLAPYVYLDTNVRGLSALAASKELIDSRWPGVCGRFIVFGLIMALIQMIPVIGWLVSGFAFPALSVIFPWLLYQNLKELEGSNVEI